MIIEFEDKALEDLYITGTTSDNRYKRLPRLLFKTSPNEEGILVNALITEISKHYE